MRTAHDTLRKYERNILPDENFRADVAHASCWENIPWWPVGLQARKSATIKSPEMVQFTASDGEKLTDTFCYCGNVTVGDEPQQHSLTMSRVTAMVRFQFTGRRNSRVAGFVKFDYTGGFCQLQPAHVRRYYRNPHRKREPHPSVATICIRCSLSPICRQRVR